MCTDNDEMYSHEETAAIMSQEKKRKERKERKYPCGYPGCQWVFTRTNHVARHHERVHPGFKPVKSNLDNKGQTNVLDRAPVSQSSSILQKHKTPIRAEQKLIDKSNKNLTFPLKCFSFTVLPEVEHNYVCDENSCNKCFSSKKEYNEHLFRIHHIVEPEICLRVEEDKEWVGDENKKSMDSNEQNQLVPHFDDNRNLSTYEPVKFLRPPRPFICDMPGCEKTYTKHSHLVRHKVETHKMEKPRSKSARGQLSIAGSVSEVDNSSERPFPCDYPGCGWSFKRQYHLNRHIVTHNNKFLTSFPRNSEDSSDVNDGWSNMNNCLKFEMNSENKHASNTVVIEEMNEEDVPIVKLESNFMCDFPSCGQTFSEKSLLDEHYVVHSGPSLVRDGNDSVENNLLKAIDDKAYHAESLLECVLHEINEDSPLKTCYEQNSTQINNCEEILIDRKRKSMEKRIFICDIPGCAKKFGRNCELTRHKLNHTDVWPFRCEFIGCGRKFKRKDVFKNHQRTHGRDYRDAKESDSSDSWPKSNLEDKISLKKENVDLHSEMNDLNPSES
ncbi:zinc finger protein 84-like protein [Leptotrombidium deliense]|uniref:Zinc finger protein 84-like protein n=1 Tax=Leptotrombidium deliense TaxID=299467 RepID=A0A443SLY0_9ACAR|nr:zinc finger protein 84-like protein [Leptotrombidium deliense]